MEQNWTLVYTAFKVYKIEIIQALLEEAGIESNMLNKMDSTMLMGDIELYVHNDDSVKALQIIEQHPDL
ncbi:MAG: DUF2007 domain-containing protein [Saprospiraceae bacterium]|nr:DUF2007 domain-containing protein [Saprospiraceae bacterium]